MKRILIIGAGFLQDFVICKAKLMGYETYTVDANPNAIGFRHADHYGVVDITNEKACLNYAKKNQINGVLTAATDFGVLSAAFIAREMGLPGLNYEVARVIKNKYRMKKSLFENHVDNTEQVYEVSRESNIEELAKKLSYPVMVKPCDGSGSRGTSRVDKADNLKKACELAIADSITHRAEIETFIVGKEYGAESLVVNGVVHVLGIMQKWMTKHPYYAELGHAIPNDLSPEIEDKVRICVINAIKTLGINYGSVNMDLLITDDGMIYIVDMGARMGGNMIGPCIIPYGTGVDYMGAMLQNAVGETVDLSAQKSMAVASRIRAFKGGIVKKLPNINEVEKKYGVEIYHHLEIGMKVNEYHTNLDGCGYIIARAESLKKAKDVAETVFRYLEDIIFEE